MMTSSSLDSPRHIQRQRVASLCRVFPHSIIFSRGTAMKRFCVSGGGDRRINRMVENDRPNLVQSVSQAYTTIIAGDRCSPVLHRSPSQVCERRAGASSVELWGRRTDVPGVWNCQTGETRWGVTLSVWKRVGVGMWAFVRAVRGSPICTNISVSEEKRKAGTASLPQARK